MLTPHAPAPAVIEEDRQGSADQTIGRWVVLYIAIISGEDADTLDLSAPLSYFDVDSLDAVEMAFEFEKKFAREVDPEIFMDSDRTIVQLIEALAVG